MFTAAVIAVLVALSLVLTGSVLDPNITAGQIEAILGGCVRLTLVIGGGLGVKALRARRAPGYVAEVVDRSGRDDWRTPPLDAARARCGSPSGPGSAWRCCGRTSRWPRCWWRSSWCR